MFESFHTNKALSTNKKVGENYGLLILSLFKKYSIEFAFSDCLVDCEKGN